MDDNNSCYALSVGSFTRRLMKFVLHHLFSQFWHTIKSIIGCLLSSMFCCISCRWWRKHCHPSICQVVWMLIARTMVLNVFGNDDKCFLAIIHSKFFTRLILSDNSKVPLFPWIMIFQSSVAWDFSTNGIKTWNLSSSDKSAVTGMACSVYLQSLPSVWAPLPSLPPVPTTIPMLSLVPILPFVTSIPPIAAATTRVLTAVSSDSWAIYIGICCKVCHQLVWFDSMETINIQGRGWGQFVVWCVPLCW